MTTIIVTGQIAQHPYGGVTWDFMNYLLGLKALGYDVYYYEENAEWSYNSIKNSTTEFITSGLQRLKKDKWTNNILKSAAKEDTIYHVKYLEKVMRYFGLSDKWCYCVRNSNTQNNFCFGINNKEMQKLFSSADAIMNLCGACNLDLIEKINGKKILIDEDPMSIQLKMLNKKEHDTFLKGGHDYFFTFGENIHRRDCKIPIDKGVAWKTTRFPVHLDAWKFKINKKANKFTTVSSWQSYKGFNYKSERYSGCKSVEFLKFSNLPSMLNKPFELAFSITGNTVSTAKIKKAKNSLNKMKANGWSILDSLHISKNWLSYKNYIYDSKAEFSVAKELYTKAKTGWFSCRSTCYLAAGRPAVLQETGFSKFIPTGKGLFSFSNMQEAIDAINEINKDYEFHCKEARKIAEKY